jgi:hypothetical protein
VFPSIAYRFSFALAVGAACASVPQAAPRGAPFPNLVIFVGSGVGCDYLTVQAAVNAAAARAGADTIALANNRSYTAQEIQIADTEGVILVGGYDACLGARTGSTELSGTGGNPAPVIRHTGAAPLTLQNLRITGGDAINAGGGLDSQGTGALRLGDVAFIGNRGVGGGGVSAAGLSPLQPKSVYLVGLVSFNGNTADAGGGLFLMHATLFPLFKPTLIVADNVAEAGDGGGWYLLNAHVRGNTPGEGFGCTMTFAGNRASDRGGGLFVHARGAEVRVELRPRRDCGGAFVGNEAGVSGGAIQVHADGSTDAPPDSTSRVQLKLLGQQLNDNSAPDGAAVMSRSTRVGMRQANASVSFLPAAGSDGLPWRCNDPPLSVCPAMYRNVAQGGAVVALVADGDAPAFNFMTIGNAALADNLAVNLVRVSGAETSFVLADSLVTGGGGDRVLAALDDARVSLLRSTLADVSVEASSVLLGDRRFLLEGSIAIVPGREILRMRQANNEAEIRDLLRHAATVVEPFDHPPASTSGVLAASDPGFVDAPQRDYRLRPASPAIDRHEVLDVDQLDALDLDLRMRGLDAPASANPPGHTWDLGAYEFVVSELFGNGFEGTP